jgi:hypothetical protein
LDPDIVFTVSPTDPDGEGGYYISQPLIQFSTTDTGASILYDIGDGEREYEDSFSLQDGIYGLSAYSIDPSGRRSETISNEIKVDLSDPDIILIVEPEDPDGESDFFITTPTLTFIPDSGSTALFSINGGPEIEYTIPFELEDGEYEIEFCAKNPSGRRGSTFTRFIKVDTSIPDLSSSFDPPLCPGWCTEPTYMTLGVDDEDSMIFFEVDGEGPFEYSSSVLLNDGEYDISVWAIDTAGNRVDLDPIEVRIDTTAPITEIKFDRNPDQGLWYYDIAPRILLETVNEAISTETTYFSLDGEQYSVFDSQDIELSPGQNTIYYYSIDSAGNQEKVRSKDIGIDISPPDGRIEVNRTLIPVRGMVYISIEGSTDDNHIYRFKVDFGDGTVSDWIYGNDVEHFYSDLGKYEVTVTVEDISGRKNSEELSVTIEVLSQSEYDERLRDGPPLFLIILIVILIFILIAGSAVILAIVYHKRKTGDVEEIILD